jgi:hypothetical protein
MMTRSAILFSSISILFAGCGQVFSPYLMLPSEPLHADDFQVVATAGGLPVINETFPGVDFGGAALVRYGITDRFSFQGETWTRSFVDYHPAGFSLEGVELLSDRKSSWRFAVIPRLAVMTSANALEGWGASGTLAAWTPELLGGHPYLGIGALVGSGDTHPLYGTQYVFGFGGCLNAGIAYEIFEHVTVNGEFTSQEILMHDAGHYYGNGFWVLGIGAGYRF